MNFSRIVPRFPINDLLDGNRALRLIGANLADPRTVTIYRGSLGITIAGANYAFTRLIQLSVSWLLTKSVTRWIFADSGCSAQTILIDTITGILVCVLLADYLWNRRRDGGCLLEASFCFGRLIVMYNFVDSDPFTMYISLLNIGYY